MVNDRHQDTCRKPVKQGIPRVLPEPNRIGASTPYDFEARNLTAYGGLLPVATLLEKLGFQQLVKATLTVKRKTKSLTMYRFVLAMVLVCYVGFSRLYHLRFLKREPMLTGILAVQQLPPQCTCWRFLASVHEHERHRLRGGVPPGERGCGPGGRQAARADARQAQRAPVGCILIGQPVWQNGNAGQSG